MQKIKYILMFVYAFALCACGTLTSSSKPQKADIIVYGGTSAGVITAIQAAKEGKTVILVAPEKQLGAMTTAGLGSTDAGKTYAIGGLSRQFYHKVWEHYQKPESWKQETRSDFVKRDPRAMNDSEQVMWAFEPKVAERIYKDWLAEYPDKITVFTGEYLDRSAGGVIKDGKKIVAIKTLSGKTFEGKIFVDTTFEGDLMAAAGCKYTVGREANSQYSETYNGYRDTLEHNGHFFRAKVDPYVVKGKKESGLLKYISPEPPVENGSADNRVQAYCFRMCLTNDPDNIIKIQKPENYNADDYELYLRHAEACTKVFGYDKFNYPMIISKMPNKKTDCNNRNAFSTDFIGGNYNYPEASYAEREKIVKAHKDYQLGILYFWQNDPRVNERIRKQLSQYGLPKDEFLETNGWPFYLYVREARRMIGDYVMTQHNCQNTIETPKPIGMGSYTLDSHNTSRCVGRDGFVQNEGDVQVGLKNPYKIAYGAVLPQRSDCSNLLVPVACSASHISYGSIRMEPVFMILGQSCATAASMAIDANIPVQDVDYKKLSEKLLKDKQILSDPRKAK